MKKIARSILALSHLQTTANRSKTKIAANFFIVLLTLGLIIAAVVGFNSLSRQASAQPPYPVPNVIVSASGNGQGSATMDAQGQYSITSYLGTWKMKSMS